MSSGLSHSYIPKQLLHCLSLALHLPLPVILFHNPSAHYKSLSENAGAIGKSDAGQRISMTDLCQLSLVSAVLFPTRQVGRQVEGGALGSMSLACMSGLRSPCRGYWNAIRQDQSVCRR